MFMLSRRGHEKIDNKNPAGYLYMSPLTPTSSTEAIHICGQTMATRPNNNTSSPFSTDIIIFLPDMSLMNQEASKELTAAILYIDICSQLYCMGGYWF
jgi:hypothetical protein